VNLITGGTAGEGLKKTLDQGLGSLYNLADGLGTAGDRPIGTKCNGSGKNCDYKPVAYMLNYERAQWLATHHTGIGDSNDLGVQTLEFVDSNDIGAGSYTLYLKVERVSEPPPPGQALTEPPEAVITSEPSGAVSSTSARFEFASTHPGSTFRCSLDGAALSSCASPKDYSGLTDGTHTFEVFATNAVGVRQMSSTARSWSVDTTRPAMSSLKPTPGSKTRDRTPLLGATVKDTQTDLAKSDIGFFVDGGAKAFTYDSTTDRLSYLSGRLPYGRHTAKVTATDAAGNTTTKSWSFTVVR
jgi:hypothetical protein